jgi:hypothetical protein
MALEGVQVCAVKAHHARTRRTHAHTPAAHLVVGVDILEHLEPLVEPVLIVFAALLEVRAVWVHHVPVRAFEIVLRGIQSGNSATYKRGRDAREQLLRADGHRHAHVPVHDPAAVRTGQPAGWLAGWLAG